MLYSFKRVIAMGMVLCMVLTSTVVGSAQTENGSRHWAAQTLDQWMTLGLIETGGRERINPDAAISRVDFIHMINKVFGFTEKTENQFTDVPDIAWYTEDVAKATAAGYAVGSGGRFCPEAELTRQEAAVMLFKAFKLKIADDKKAQLFSDFSSMSPWSVEAISVLAQSGYIANRSGSKFLPLKAITLAEACTMISNIMGDLKNKAGTYTGILDKNLVVNAADVTLKDMTIKGNLYLTEGIGSGNITLENVKIQGQTIVQGGGMQSIVLRNTILNGILVVEKKDGKVRIFAEGSTAISGTQLNSGAKLQQDKTKKNMFGTVEATERIPQNQTLQLDGNFDTVIVEAPGVEIDIADGRVGSLEVAQDAKNTELKIGKSATVDRLVAAADISVANEGVISKAETTGNTKIKVIPVQSAATSSVGTSSNSTSSTTPTPSPTPTPTPAPMVGLNLLQNPSFESGLESWTLEKTGNGTIVYLKDDKGIEGDRKYINLWDGGAYTVSFTQTLTGLAAGRYELSVYAMDPGVDTYYLEASGFGGQAKRTDLLSTSWSAYSEKKVVDVDVTSGTLTYKIYAGDNGGGWTFFDNCSLAYVGPIPDVTPLPDAAFVNGDFEDGTNGWVITQSDNWPMYTGTTSGVNNSKCLEVYKGAGEVYNATAQQTLTQIPNGVYKINLKSISWNLPQTAYMEASGYGGNSLVTHFTQGGTYRDFEVNNIYVTNHTLVFKIVVAGTGENDIKFDNCTITYVSETPSVSFQNPGFEDGSAGWIITGTGEVKNDGKMNGEKGFSVWGNAAYASELTQTITNIPQGIYDVSIYARTYDNSLPEICYIEASGFGGLAQKNLKADWDFEKNMLSNLKVTSGTLTLKIYAKSKETADRYYHLDEAEIVFKGSIVPETTPVSPTGDLQKPAGLSGFSTRGHQVDLIWNKSEDNRVTGYHVYRNNILIGQASAASVYTDAGADLGAVYQYKVEAFGDEGIVSAASDPITVTAYDAVGEAPRQVGIQPFAWDSYINMPIGSGAQYADLRYEPQNFWVNTNSESGQWSGSVYVAKTTDPVAKLYTRDGFGTWQWPFLDSNPGKNSGYDQATEQHLIDTSHLGSNSADQAHYNKTTVPFNSDQGGVRVPPQGIHISRVDYLSQFYMPVNAVPSEDSDGAIDIVQPDGFVVEGYASVVLSSAQHGLVTSFNSIFDGKGDGTGVSANGVRAGGMTFLGGIIRQGELNSGKIHHALAGVGTKSFISEAAVWPSVSFDPNYGQVTPRPEGTPIGALLAIPPDINIDSIQGLSEEGKVIGHALQDYGYYLADRGGDENAPPAISLQFDTKAWDMYEWVNNLTGQEELRILMKYLKRVVNNSSSSIGGGGTPRVGYASDKWADDNGDTQAPSVPTGLAAITTSSAVGVDLTWDASSDNTAVYRYYIYRDGKLVGSSDTNSFTDTGYFGNPMVPGTVHQWTVTAMDQNRNRSGTSAALTFTVPDTAVGVFNGSFEENLSEWGTWPWQESAARPAITKGTSHSGTQCVQFTTVNPSNAQSIEQAITVRASTTYTATVWVKSAGSGIGITVLRYNDLTQRYDTVINTASTSSSEWTPVSVTFTTGQNENKVLLRLEAYEGSGGFADEVVISRQ